MTRSLGFRILFRVLQLVGVLFAVAVVSFMLEAAAPGDLAEARVGIKANLSPQARAVLIGEARKELGLDKPLPVQFALWLSHAARFDFGTADNGDRVSSVVRTRLGPTLEIALTSALIAVPLALLLALASASYRGRAWTHVMDSVLVGGLVVPPFWIGILLVLLFSVELHLLPASGYVPFNQDPSQHIRRLILPAATLAVPQITIYYRYVREGLQSALRSQYVRAARATGLSERVVLVRHALPNALLPALTIFGIYLGSLIGGVVVIESVFSWPGVGSLLIYSVERSDYNTLVAIVLFTAAFYVCVSTLVDFAYLALDPRTRRS